MIGPLSKYFYQMQYSVYNTNRVYYSKTYFPFGNPAKSGKINCFGAFFSVPVIARCWWQIRWGRNTLDYLLGPLKHIQTFSTDSVPLWLIRVHFYSVYKDFFGYYSWIFNVRNMAIMKTNKKRRKKNFGAQWTQDSRGSVRPNKVCCKLFTSSWWTRPQSIGEFERTPPSSG